MDSPTKIVLGGITAGLLILGVGSIGYWRCNSRVIELVVQCQAESLKPRTSSQEPWKDFRPDPLVCDPARLRFLDSNSTVAPVQTEIVNQTRRADNWFGYSAGFAFAVAFLSFLPYGWYFLLRRIRELRNAIAGE